MTVCDRSTFKVDSLSDILKFINTKMGTVSVDHKDVFFRVPVSTSHFWLLLITK